METVRFRNSRYNMTEAVTRDQCIEAEGHEDIRDLDCSLLGCDTVKFYG